MNILSAKTSGQSLSITPKNSQVMKLADGALYSGQVTSLSKGKIGIMLDSGYEFTAKAGNINQRIGDRIDLMAEKNKTGGFTMRIVGGAMPENAGQAMSPCQTRDLFKQSGFISEENIYEIKQTWEDEDAEAKEKLAISRIQAKISYAADNLTMHAVNELLASGVSIQSLNLSMLSSVLKEVRESPEALTQADMDCLIDEKMKAFGVDTESLEEKAKIIGGLANAGLPVNESNIDFIEKCLKIYDEAGALSDGAIAQLIKADGQITLSALYTAAFVESLRNENAPTELLDEQLAGLFQAEGIEDTKANRENALLLFEHDLPITKENLDMVAYLKSFHGDEGMERVIKAGTDAIRDGLRPDSAIAAEFQSRQSLRDVYEKITEFLPLVNNRQIAYVNALNLPMTLENLRHIEAPEDFEFSVEDDNAKYLLIQIQHRLTHEAAQRLIGKGINIDVMNISKALKEVRQAEREVFAAHLGDEDMEANEANLHKMDESISAKRQVKFMPSGLYAGVAKGEVNFSINGMDTARARMAAMDQFEKFSAHPDAKYADSYEKAAESLKGLLENMGLPPTEENLRQVEILSKSGMDISKDNLLKIKIIDIKVNGLYEGLTPRILANMLKTGFDPLNAHIDQVLDYIENYRKDHGESSSGAVAQGIYDMEKSGQLKPEEKDSLIAMYRMMNRLEKDGFAALGLNIRAGHVPTLKSLMDMAAGNHVDRDVSEEGYMEQLSTDMERALNRISHRGESNENAYAALVMKSFGENINRANLEKLLANPVLMEMPLDEMMEFLTEKSDAVQKDPGEAEILRTYQDVKTVLDQKAEVFSFLESIGLLATVANIKAYVDLSKPAYFSETISEIAEEADSDPAAFMIHLDETDTADESQPAEAMNQMAEKLEESVLNQGKTDLLKEIRLLQNAVKVQNAISKRQNNFKIPVDIGGRPGQLNMFMPHGYIPAEGDISVAVSIHVGESTLSALCSLKGNLVDMTLNFQNIETPVSGELQKRLSAAFGEYGLKGSIEGFGEINGYSGQFDILPEIGTGHKEALFNLGKAIMKFADNIINSD